MRKTSPSAASATIGNAPTRQRPTNASAFARRVHLTGDLGADVGLRLLADLRGDGVEAAAPGKFWRLNAFGSGSKTVQPTTNSRLRHPPPAARQSAAVSARARRAEGDR